MAFVIAEMHVKHSHMPIIIKLHSSLFKGLLSKEIKSELALIAIGSEVVKLQRRDNESFDRVYSR